MADDIKRTYPEDPHRCQASVTNGQCMNLATENTKFCKYHTPQTDHTSIYKLIRYKSRFTELTAHDKYKSLHEEVAILRMTLESLLNTIEQNEIPIYVARITSLINGIRQTIETADKLDHKSGEYLGKATLLKFSGALIDLISEEVTTPEALERIAIKIGELVASSSIDEVTHGTGS